MLSCKHLSCSTQPTNVLLNEDRAAKPISLGQRVGTSSSRRGKNILLPLVTLSSMIPPAK